MTKRENELADKFESRGIPGHMVDGLALYVTQGLGQGGFLTALLENDFMRAAGQADDMNIYALKAYAMVFFNDIPASCYGSPEKVDAWMKHRGEAGQ